MTPEPNHQQAEPNADNCYPLDEPAIALFADGLRQIELLNASMNGALQLFVKQHGLEGRWQLAPNRRELERI